MLATRRLVSSSVSHIACPLVLEDGSTVLLTAMASSLYVRLPVWRPDGDGKMSCFFSLTNDELNIGTVAVALVPCAHQCFMVITQDYELLVGRYQANLPAPPTSWLVNDLLHHNNAWIILHRGRLSGAGVTSHLVQNSRMLFAYDISGTLVHCSVIRGWRHTVRIDIPANTPSTFFREKWVFDTAQSMGPYSSNVAPFRRNVLEQADEELLKQWTVAQLAQRKHTQRPPATGLSVGFPPVDVIVQFQALDEHILSMALIPAAPHDQRKNQFVFAFSHSTMLSIFDDSCFFLGRNMPINLCASGPPYLVLATPGYLLTLSLVGGLHVLSTLDITHIFCTSAFNPSNSCRSMRIARSSQQPFAGVVVQNKGVDGGCVLWLLVGNGFLTEVSIEALELGEEGSFLLDAPGIQSGDCEDGNWLHASIVGLPRGFRACSLVPFWRDGVAKFQPYSVTERYAVLSDGVSDVYLVDLIERRVVGSLPSHGAMTSACDGPDMDLIVAYSKGMLQRISPGVRAPARVCAEFAGVHKLFALPHKNSTQSTGLVFYFLATTATHTVLFRGAMGQLKELRGEEADEVVLDEPTRAVYSATCFATLKDEDTATLSACSLHFAQCTNKCINFGGQRIPFINIFPELDDISHACFAGDEFIAVANHQITVIFLINSNDKCNSTLTIHLQERFSADVSHLTAWRAHGLCQWGVAACLWSHKIVVWFISSVGETRRYELPIKNDVVASSFPLPDGSVGLTLLNRTVAVLYGATVDDLPTVAEIVDVNDELLRAECCFPITAYGTAAAVRSGHFHLLALCDNRAELIALMASGVVEEQVRVALSTPPNFFRGFGKSNNVVVGYEYTDVVRMTPLRCGFVLYIADFSFYVFVLSNGSDITIWSLPELLSPPATSTDSCFRRGFLLCGPVEYQVTHALQLPFITAYSHRLTRAAYLPFSNTIVTLTDRGEETSLVNTIDADVFLMIDGLPMAAGEVPTCMESFLVFGTDVVVIGTAAQLVTDSANEPKSGRLLLLHVRPLRISATAYITTGGVLDVSVQSRLADHHLIAVAGMGHVFVYRLAGLSLSLVCSTETKSACTTVALRFPFISCGLYMLGTQYFELLPEGRSTTNAEMLDHDDYARKRRGSDFKESYSNDECIPMSRWCEATFVLKTCALEPTAFTNVHSQTVYGENFARADAERNVVTVKFCAASEPAVDEVPETRVVGVEGSYSSALTRCFRLPSLPLQVVRSGHARAPWRHRSAPFVSWCDRQIALRLVGDTLLLPCADGSLYCAGEIPFAFASPLLRLEQCITELYDTTMSLSLIEDTFFSSRYSSFGGAFVRRTHHSVSFAAENAVRNATRMLRKQFFLCVDAIEEYFFVTRLVELPDPLLTPEECELVWRKKRMLDEHLAQIWAEYPGGLRDVDLGVMLRLW